MFQRGYRVNSIPILAVLLALSTVAGTDGTATFDFAQVGMAYSAALFEDDPIVGKEVVSTKIILEVLAYPGSDAADFTTDLLLPVEPFEGCTNMLVLSGAEMGWSGEGVFSYTEETESFNGIFVARKYGAETYGIQGRILKDSRIELRYIGGGGCKGVEEIENPLWGEGWGS